MVSLPTFKKGETLTLAVETIYQDSRSGLLKKWRNRVACLTLSEIVTVVYVVLGLSSKAVSTIQTANTTFVTVVIKESTGIGRSRGSPHVSVISQLKFGLQAHSLRCLDIQNISPLPLKVQEASCTFRVMKLKGI